MRKVAAEHLKQIRLRRIGSVHSKEKNPDGLGQDFSALVWTRRESSEGVMLFPACRKNTILCRNKKAAPVERLSKWTRRESNSGPNKRLMRFLHV